MQASGLVVPGLIGAESSKHLKKEEAMGSYSALDLNPKIPKAPKP